MKLTVALLAPLALLCSVSRADAPPADVVAQLTEAIRKVCPDAKIATGDEFRASYGTMVFTIHGQSMTGEYSARPDKREGPNYKGFLLRLSWEKGKYNGQAVVPQELHGPYFPTFLDARATPDGKDHYLISFSYGGRLDPKIKRAILDALPGAKKRR